MLIQKSNDEQCMMLADPTLSVSSIEPIQPNSTTRTPATNTSYKHHQRTPPTDKNLPHPNVLTCRDQGRIQEFAIGGVLSFPPLLSFPSLPLPPLFFPPSLPLPLRSRSSLNQLGGMRERCKLPQRGPGRSPDRKRMWCTLKL